MENIVSVGFELARFSAIMVLMVTGWRQRADELSETTKLFTLLGTYIHQQHGSRNSARR